MGQRRASQTGSRERGVRARAYACGGCNSAARMSPAGSGRGRQARRDAEHQRMSARRALVARHSGACPTRASSEKKRAGFCRPKRERFSRMEATRCTALDVSRSRAVYGPPHVHRRAVYPKRSLKEAALCTKQPTTKPHDPYVSATSLKLLEEHRPPLYRKVKDALLEVPPHGFKG